MSRRKMQLRSEAALVVDPSEAELISFVYDSHDACMPPRVSISTTEVVMDKKLSASKTG